MNRQTLLRILRKTYVSSTLLLGVISELCLLIFLIYFILGAVK